MWLAYLRFDTNTETRVALVLCSNKDETKKVLATAKEVFGLLLTQYATFYSGRAIYPEDVPNFPEELIFSYASFMEACHQRATTPPRPPGSPARPQLQLDGL